MANDHAYSILKVFTLTMGDGSVEKFLMMRNPWGLSNYTNEQWRGMGDWAGDG